MAALSPEVKAFIVQALACFDTPTQIASQVKQEFGLDISIQQVSSYDPTKAIAKNLGQKWIDLFNATRTRFQTELSDIPIANKAYRLRALNRMMTSAEKMRNMALAASLMEQAAKEVSGIYTSRLNVETAGKSSSNAQARAAGINPQETADAFKKMMS